MRRLHIAGQPSLTGAFLMSIFKHDDIRFHFELRGQGPTVVFCHGLTGDLSQGDQLIGPLPGYRLLLWDCRAHGETAPVGPVTELSFASFAKDLEALISHLEIDKVVVGGNSMGAAVAVRFALDCPQAVRGLFLIRPAWLDAPLPIGLKLYPLLADYLELHGCEQGLIEFQKLGDYQSLLEKAPDAAKGLTEQFHKPLAVERRERLRRIPNDCPIGSWRETESLLMPSLVVGNEPDFVHPWSYAQTWADRLPRGHLVQVPPKHTNPAEHAQACRSHFWRFLRSLG